MNQNIKDFQIGTNGKILDYRTGKNLDLKEVKSFFEKQYAVKQLWDRTLFLKLATTEGISAVTKNDMPFAFNLK